jgi:hypothetical protein
MWRGSLSTATDWLTATDSPAHRFGTGMVWQRTTVKNWPAPGMMAWFGKCVETACLHHSHVSCYKLTSSQLLYVMVWQVCGEAACLHHSRVSCYGINWPAYSYSTCVLWFGKCVETSRGSLSKSQSGQLWPCKLILLPTEIIGLSSVSDPHRFYADPDPKRWDCPFNV